MEISTPPVIQGHDANVATPELTAVRRELRGHDTRSRTTIHGRGAIVFGSVFFAAGTFVVLCALNVIPTDDASYHAPRALVATIGGLLFALPGGSLIVHGAIGAIRARRRRRDRLHDLDRPWRGDHDWDQRGESSRGFSPFLRRAWAVVGLSLFLFPFHWLAMAKSDAWPLLVFLGIFDLIVFGVAVDAALRLARALRFGRMDVRYDRFPFHPGECVTLHFGLARARRFRSLRLTLRCVQEAYETRGSGKNRSEQVVSYVVREAIRELGPDRANVGPGRDVSVSFDVPRDAPGTDLASRPPRYWQLHVRGDASGPDLDAAFLVPIYDRP